MSTPISCAADWRKLTVCPCTQGSNARELRHLQLVLEKLKGEEVPVIFTAFTPITIADKISGGKLISYIEEGHGDVYKRQRAPCPWTALRSCPLWCSIRRP